MIYSRFGANHLETNLRAVREPQTTASGNPITGNARTQGAVLDAGVQGFGETIVS